MIDTFVIGFIASLSACFAWALIQAFWRWLR